MDRGRVEGGEGVVFDNLRILLVVVAYSNQYTLPVHHALSTGEVTKKGLFRLHF